MMLCSVFLYLIVSFTGETDASECPGVEGSTVLLYIDEYL
jgi:hypothetical protein